MNIPEKLAEAVNRQDWQLVSEVHEALTGQPLDLPEDRNVGPEMVKGLENFLEALKCGEAPPSTIVHRETIPVEEETIVGMTTPKKKKKKTKRQKKATQKVITIDENSSDPVVDDADLYEPERTGDHIEAKRGGAVKVDKTKTELITCEVDEEERAANAKKAIPRQRRKIYKEFKYKCYRCDKEQKSPKCLSAENVKNFVCDECGKGVIRRS